jgi:hypothetical protein
MNLRNKKKRFGSFSRKIVGNKIPLETLPERTKPHTKAQGFLLPLSSPEREDYLTFYNCKVFMIYSDSDFSCTSFETVKKNMAFKKF